MDVWYPNMDANFDWDDLKVLLAAYREGSLSGAGKRLSTSQSTASRRLAGLEGQLSAQLFDRRPGGILATELAEQLVPLAEQVEQLCFAMINAVSGTETQLEGTVRLALTEGLSSYVVAPALPELRTRHPKIRVELVIGNHLVDLTRREADLALRLVRPVRGDLVAKCIHSDPWRAFASPTYLATSKQKRKPERLDWLTWDEGLALQPDNRWLQRHATREPILRTTSMSTLIAAAQSGLGAVLLPQTFGDALPGLARIPGILPDLPRAKLWLVGHRELKDVPRLRAVWQFVEELIAGLARRS